MQAVLEIGGKQYKVKEGDTIKVEKLALDEGAVFESDSVLALLDGGNITVGKPYVSGAAVSATVVEQGKHKKVVVYKFKAKKGFHKKKGHRQPFTALKVNSIKGA